MLTKTLDISRYVELERKTRILLGPGPSMIHPRVAQAMASPMIGHLDPYFLEIMDRTQELLRYTFQTENQLTIPISGTGSAAMEASVANMIEPGDEVLVCVNGYFGLRLADMAERYGGVVETIHRPWGEVFSPEEIQESLSMRPAKIVAIVHAETSTGAMQPLTGISKMVHAQGGILIVDAVTSLGGIPFFVDKEDIDVCYSGSQKCLSSPPGIGPITLGHRAINLLNSRKNKVANWYLDLSIVNKYWSEERSYHHTAPISSNFAFYESLRIVAEEGLENRWERHRQNAEYLWAGLEDIGLSLLVPQEYRLNSLTTVCVPDGIDEAAVRSQLLEQFNIEISGGLGELKGKVWRIGLMGYSSRKENILALLAGLKQVI